MTEIEQPASLITLDQESSTFTIRIQFPRPTAERRQQVIISLLYLAALICAIYGNSLLRGANVSQRHESLLAEGGPYLWIAIFIWLVAELIVNWQALKSWWERRDRLGRAKWPLRILPLLFAVAGVFALVESMSASPDFALELVQRAVERFALALIIWVLIDAVTWWTRNRRDDSPQFAGWIGAKEPAQPESILSQLASALISGKPISLVRIVVLSLAILASAVVWANTTGNIFRPPFVALWLLSAVLWALVFAPAKWNLFSWLYSRLCVDWFIPWRRFWWAYISFVLIMIAGISFRLTSLDIMPPEILNDPYVNLVDAYDLAQGTETPVYFYFNNGRPLLTFYLAAALASIPGFGFDYYTLKLSTALSSVAALPVMLWLGITFAGEQRRKFGIVLGLLLSGLVAASYWDAAISRLGASFALPPLFAALLGVLLIRAIRHNRLVDYVLAGLALGFSLYTYAPTRVYPLVVVAAVLIALVVREISWRERLRYVVHAAVLAWVAFMVFQPMFHYMLEEPDQFWRRAEQVILDSPSDQAEEGLIRENVATFMTNVRKHLLMYNWSGTSFWVRGLPGAPTLDIYTGALLVLGLAALGVRMLKSRDPVIWMLPVILVIMHLPALVILAPEGAYEIPSNARTLGALPFVYLLAAFPLALIGRQFLRAFPKPIAWLLGSILFSAVLLLANQQNTSLYFGKYLDRLHELTAPASEGGKIIRGFVDSGGSLGNTFIFNRNGIAEPRFIAAEAGALYFPNVVWRPSDISSVVKNALDNEDYPLNPNLDLFFLLSPSHLEAESELRRLFPRGYLTEIPSRRKENYGYAVYRVPAPGTVSLAESIAGA